MPVSIPFEEQLLGSETEDDEADEEDEDEDEDYYPPPPVVRRTTRNSPNPAASRIVFEEHPPLQPHPPPPPPQNAPALFLLEDEDLEVYPLQPRRIVLSEDEDEEDEEEGEEDEEEEQGRRYGGETSSSPSRGVGGGGGGEEESNGSQTDGSCCPICMESWSSDGVHQISCLPCGHIYGFSCIERWIRQKKTLAKCPQCSRRCMMKDIIRLYVSRILVTDGEQQKKLQSLQAENEFLKMKIANLQEKICQVKDENVPNQEVYCIENNFAGEVGRRAHESVGWMGDSQAQRQSGYTSGFNFGTPGSPCCSFELEDELIVEGARIFDIDAASQVLILARRLSGMGGNHLLTKISLMYPYESENIHLPPCTKAIKDLRVSPGSSRLALFASLGNKLSVLSMESNNVVLTYDLPAPAWSCSWDLNSPHHLYAGLQNGMLLAFDMRQTVRPMESINGLSCHPIHTIHSLLHKPPTPSGVRTVLTASSIGPCIWNTGGLGERPIRVPQSENQDVCISLAYCSLSDDIVASFRPKVQTSHDIASSQSSLQSSPSGLGRGIRGSHVLIKRVGASSYQNLGLVSANVSDVLMPKSAIVSIDGCNPLFAYGEEVNRSLNLRELPFLRDFQTLRQFQKPVLDVKYAHSLGRGILGCTSEDRLQIFSPRIS